MKSYNLQLKVKNTDFKKELINKGFNLAKSLMKLTDRFPSKRAAWVITDQLLRSGTSIGANIIEAQAASSRKDFTNFLSHALKSGNETKFWLTLSKELDLKLAPEIDNCLTQTDELVRILSSSLITLRGRNK